MKISAALISALSITLAVPALAQDLNAGSNALNASQNQTRERRSIAESLVKAREAASGLTWEPSFRASFAEQLASLSLDSLRQIQPEGDLSALLGGAQPSDQVFTPVRPCRFVDGIQAADRVFTFANGTTNRYYRVRGSTPTDFISQGAAASAPGGCGIPLSATAVAINATVADPDADGDLKVDPSNLTASSTSTLNYTFGGARGKNLANGVTVQLCNLLVSTCTSGATPTSPTRDILVTFHSGSSSHSTYFLADVVGYYSAPQQPELGTIKAAAHINGIVSVGVAATVSRCFVITSVTNASSTCTPNTTVVVTRLSEGAYEVDFGLNVASRFFTGVQGNSATGTPPGGTIDVTPRSGNQFAVFVQTRNPAGVLTDSNFYVQVY